MGVGMSVLRPPLSPPLPVWEWKSWLLMGEVIKSGVEVTFPLQGEVQSQPKVGGGGKGRGLLLSPLLPLSLHQVPHPVPGESGLGWGPGLSTPASGLCAQGEVTWLAYTMALSQFQPRLLQRWALPVPLQALPVLGAAAQTVRLPRELWNVVELLVASLAVWMSVGGILGNCTMCLLAPLCRATRQWC